MMNVTGNPDGSSAVDYTVNCALGFPFVTGPAHGTAPVNPVNHVLPAWDAIAGVTAAMGILAAERHRRLTGAGTAHQAPARGCRVRDDGESRLHRGSAGEPQPSDGRPGNYLYGAYGCEFETGDERFVYVVAITRRQWDELCKATGLGDKLAMLGPLLGVDLAKEGDRFKAREAISAVLAPWFRQRTLDDISSGVRRHRRVLGSLSDLPADGRGRSPLLDRESALLDDRAARNRIVSRARIAAAVRGRGPGGAAACPRPRRAHRRDSRLTCSGCPTVRSASCARRGSSPGPIELA